MNRAARSKLDTVETRPLFSDGTLKDLAPDASNVAKELIEDFMVGANGVTARFLAAKAIPSLRRVLPPPERWSRIVALAATFGAPLPSTPDAVALQAFLRARSKSDPDGLRGTVAQRGQASRRRRVCARRAGQAIARPLRPRGGRLHAFDCAQPPLSGSRHTAPAQVRARCRPRAVHQRGAHRDCGALHDAGAQCGAPRYRNTTTTSAGRFRSTMIDGSAARSKTALRPIA